MPNPDELLTFNGTDPDIEVRSESEREIGIRFYKWGEVGETESGLEMFERGAFARDEIKDLNDPAQVVLRMEHEGPPAGRGKKIIEDDKGATLIANAAPTARGDELMSLAKGGYYHGASPMFSKVSEKFGRSESGRRVAIRDKVNLREVSLTWRPTYKGTEVLYARSEEEAQKEPEAEEAQAEPQKEKEPVAEEFSPGPETPVPNPAGSLSADQEILERMRDFASKQDGNQQQLMERIAVLEARAQTDTGAVIPDPSPDSAVPRRGDWMQAALTLMDGGDLRQDQKRALADNISDDNPGFIPVVYSNDLIGVIDNSRPFIQTTRSIDMPDNGLQISYPRITQRPSVAEQTTEKTEVSSRKITTDRITADVRTFAGAGDISIQLLRRSSPSFLDAFLELLAEQYAIVTEDAAVDALLAASPTAGTGTFDPADPEFGEAFENGVAAGRSLVPDHIWLSTTAMVEFINAKSPTGGGGTPLYPGLAGIAGITGGGASGPLPMTLTPVWTPALDNETVDVIVGPSTGFRHAEEGTFSLTADVPGRLGRDVALAGFMVFVPVYPAAFTTYVVAT